MNPGQTLLNSIFPNIKSLDNPSSVQNDQIEQYIILIMGDSKVGKSSFCSRFAFNTFNLEIKESQKTESYMKKIKIFNKEINVVLVDVASNNLNDKNMLQELCNYIDGAIIIYDITSTKSFHNIEHWVDELKKLTIQQNEKKIPVFIVGNKADLQFLRTVEKETVLKKIVTLYSKLDYQNSNSGIYGYESKEVNGIDENNVQECMKDMIAQIFLMNLNEQDKEKYEKMYTEDTEN